MSARCLLHVLWSQQTRDIDPMLKQCWATIKDAGPTLVWWISVCVISAVRRVLSVLGMGGATHEFGTFPTTFFQVYFNVSNALSVIYKMKKTKVDDFFYFISVHLKNVYMVSDESMLSITFYNKSSHMHDMPRKLTLIDSLIGYLVRIIMRVSMPSLHGWFQVAGSPLNSMIPPPLKFSSLRTLALLYTQTVCSQVYNPAINMSCCVIRIWVL